MLRSGERQVAPTRDGIRRDHVARYEWAAGRLAGRVLDLACGIGYGTQILARRGLKATGMDLDAEALAYARAHYAHPRAHYRRADASKPSALGPHDAAVCFETIEHIADPLPLLKSLRRSTGTLIASVPNEDAFPWQPAYAFHHRHYTRAQFEALLNAAGWEVAEWWGQAGPESEVERHCSGRTLIVVAKRSKHNTRTKAPAAAARAPRRVAILGLGPSVTQYLEITKRFGGRSAYFDEVWTINALGDVFTCDRIFHMDDVRIQEIRARAQPGSNIAAMLKWLRRHPGPVYTSRTHPDYPGLVEYPLEAVINSTRFAYFNSTAAYAVAYAVHLGVEKLSVFGNDFTYANAHHAEKGRACVEFWLGLAAARGIKLEIPRQSSLMDACNTQGERLYGYDTRAVSLKDTGKRIDVAFREITTLPTAEEIERRYDHTAHPSPLIQTVDLDKEGKA